MKIWKWGWERRWRDNSKREIKDKRMKMREEEEEIIPRVRENEMKKTIYETNKLLLFIYLEYI